MKSLARIGCGWWTVHLFFGTEPLPLPGTRVPWFDPTPDALSCE